MSRFLISVNLIAGLFLFLVVSDMIVSWSHFATSGTKIAAFVLGIVAVGNAVYLAAGATRHK
jgi:hypothetical protein